MRLRWSKCTQTYSYLLIWFRKNTSPNIKVNSKKVIEKSRLAKNFLHPFPRSLKNAAGTQIHALASALQSVQPFDLNT